MDLSRYERTGRAATEAAIASFKGKEAGQVSIDRLQGYAIAFVVIGVVLTVGLRVLSGVDAQINDTTASEGAQQAMDGLVTFTNWLPIIALVVVSAIIIGLVSMFRNSGNGSRGMA
ncbi:hypothetical protein SAMN05443574_1404 [Haloarcula vallismortis]|uniref:Uncharacterized protein n=1 Tax=Haloarcula vallismortis TaxID=28442 RepID=A0A1H3B8W8_HALVA|nr:hypothetical protein [Haloarcula vallismortis]SDX38091.1 hypothetical protein SAMN05443574_1404 [Haloarcula vallismortis]